MFNSKKLTEFILHRIKKPTYDDEVEFSRVFQASADRTDARYNRGNIGIQNNELIYEDDLVSLRDKIKHFKLPENVKKNFYE